MTVSHHPDHQQPTTTVLIVEDEPAISDLYARWLDDNHDVRIARTGSAALSSLDENVDIVLLDRRLPDIAGEELLSDIRSREFNCRVAIISTVEPDIDIINLGFDLYVEKPVTDPETLLQAVDTLRQRSEFDARMQEYLSLASKKATLESNKPPKELRTNEEYLGLLDRVRELKEDLQEVTMSLDDDDLRVSFSGDR